MSFSELLEAVKALPREERQQVLDTLQNDVALLTPEEKILGKNFPTGQTFEVWFPESYPELVEAARLALLEQRSELE